MKSIYSFGDFDNKTCSWARIRNTVARGLDPSKFKTYALSSNQQHGLDFQPIFPKTSGASAVLDKIAKFSKIGAFLSYKLYTTWGEVILPTSHVGTGTFSLLKILKNLHVDLFHAAPYPICVKIHKILKKNNPKLKLVNTFYGFQPFAVYRWAGYQLARKADAVTCVSKTTAHQLERYFGIPSVVIHDGVDTTLFHPITHHNARPCVLFVGSLSLTRRPELFLRVAKQLPSCDFILKTNTVARSYRRLIQDHPANLRIIQRPMTHAELAPLFAHADIFFFPSLHEGFANVMLEAAASGLPLVVARATSFWEFVRDGEQGFRCNTFDEMFSRVKFLAENPEDRQRMGLMARNEALKYSWDKIIPQYASLFQSIFQ